MSKMVLEAGEQGCAVGGEPDRRDTKELQFLPLVGYCARLPANLLDVQHLVAEKSFETSSLLPVAQENLRQIGEVAMPIAAQQQFLILGQPGVLVISPAAKPVDPAHPHRMPQRKAAERRAGNGP